PANLRSQVDHHVGAHLLEEPGHLGGIGEIALGSARNDDLGHTALLEQPAQRLTQEASATGDENAPTRKAKTRLSRVLARRLHRPDHSVDEGLPASRGRRTAAWRSAAISRVWAVRAHEQRHIADLLATYRLRLEST